MFVCRKSTFDYPGLRLKKGVGGNLYHSRVYLRVDWFDSHKEECVYCFLANDASYYVRDEDEWDKNAGIYLSCVQICALPGKSGSLRICGQAIPYVPLRATPSWL
jgi:hypothetical protein